MNLMRSLPLPWTDRLLLQSVVRIVPLVERGEWLRCWHAELWHRRHPRSGHLQSAFDLYPGLIRDSIWMRTHAWHQALSGTALLCVLLLGALFLGSLLPLLTSLGSMSALFALISASFMRFLCEAVLVTMVSFATSSRTIEYESGADHRSKVWPQLFQITKLLLVLLIAFSFSEDVAQPFYTLHRFIAELIQPQIFVFGALLALRWNFQDQESRCKFCLRSLAAPARVGRPSWNFLDSNGTELLCREGHGLLSIPEIETSWRSSSRWIAR